MTEPDEPSSTVAFVVRKATNDTVRFVDINGGGVYAEGIAGTLEPISDPETVASEAVVSL